jgi:hypothetical protein
MDEPSKEFLKKVEYICSIKNKLPRRYRRRLNVGGVRYRNRKLARGEVQFIVGGLFVPKLLYTRSSDGKRVVHRYRPGDWENHVEEAFKLAPRLRKMRKTGKIS